MPTIRRCCIIGCMSNSRQHPSMQFFAFPRPESPFHKLWKEACHASLRRIIPFKKPVVCALHFDPSVLGGRRLQSNALPTLRLEVPSNMAAVEQQAMVEEIERSRKCAYINAVVYEWLVRANINPQLRGSITHGMIKDKAETARQVIGSTSFIADNRWLNRFRETHLQGFAQKLASNQLKPMGTSLWIPDIVHDLQHLFPPASAERVAKLEEMPEHYMNYMQQYGEYEEDEDSMDIKEQSYQEQQQQQHFALQQQQQHLQQQHQMNHPWPPFPGHPSHPPHPGFTSFNDYYFERHQQQMQQQLQQQQQQMHQPQFPPMTGPAPQPHREPFQPQLPPNVVPKRASPFQPVQLAKHPKIESAADIEVQEINCPTISRVSPLPLAESTQATQDLTEQTANLRLPSPKEQNNNSSGGRDSASSKENAPKTNGGLSGKSTPANSTKGNNSPAQPCTSAPASPKRISNSSSSSGSSQTNGHASPEPESNALAITNELKELDSYTDALEYLKPLEDFVLFKENFRAIGLLSQLELVLRKGDKGTIVDG
ncbi:nuclear transcription factor Y subunit beta [Drosophila pseudoobscura]|uniref:Nuclear transcription factor Y subunit beta n=1 Tax=Drosophila pseudoobscura pseudoobscura TaxID=46245 RepID=A0A6I8VM73_DROPS|nr:nuclear transcription factor Y subunit beta [Drosophila pseudoobscura]XP_015043862.2 nuclear transcription factor Y subunit beta [Drosophila pseudoobscura]